MALSWRDFEVKKTLVRGVVSVYFERMRITRRVDAT
jgi:hypothetical protein